MKDQVRTLPIMKVPMLNNPVLSAMRFMGRFPIVQYAMSPMQRAR